MKTKYCKNDSCTDFLDVLTKFEFDKDLNLIFEKSIINGMESGAYDRYAYDSRHFITQYQGLSDTYANVLYKYKLDEANRVLYQYAYKIDNYDWDYGSAKLDSSSRRVVKFQFDLNGKLLEEIDTTRETLTRYLYDDELLTGMQYFRRDKLEGDCKYEYTSGGKIKSIFYCSKTDTMSTYFSDQGVPLYANIKAPNAYKIAKYYVIYKDSITTDSR